MSRLVARDYILVPRDFRISCSTFFDVLCYKTFSMNDIYFIAADPEHIRCEKAKARELRASQWWKNQLGHGICYYCSRKFAPMELTMDHRMAIVRGGKTTK